LIRNLEAAQAKAPANPAGWRQLARIHALAYAQKTASVPVLRGREADGLWFGFEPNHVPFRVVPTEDEAARRTATAHLAKAIEHYREALRLAPDDLVTQLGYAWTLDQAGQKPQAIAQYRAVVEAAWKREQGTTRAGLGWRSITSEAAGYLIPLLDQRADNAEINTLQNRRHELSKVLRPITPIAIPLADGLTALDIVDDSAAVRFDADGSGVARPWTWIRPSAAWLVHDPRGRGDIRSALQLFGNVTFWLFWPNGYAALGALDDNADGAIAGRELDGLALWRDANRNGVSDAGEVRPVAASRIVSLSHRFEHDERHPDEIAWSPLGVTFADGTTRPTFDLVLHRR
jgi:tetratricopeptide (TPR) repeat protein